MEGGEMIFVGIDPGKLGGAVRIDIKSMFISTFSNHKDLAAFLRALNVNDFRQIRAGLENVNADPKWGRTSIFSFARNCGQWDGVLDSFLISYELIHSSKWRKLIGAAKKGKEPVVKYARRKWPEAPIVKKKDWWIADALCIAEVVRLQTIGG